MKKILWKILHFLRLAAFIQLSYKGILDELGWLKSFYKKQSIDRDGNPIPWCTYSFIYFISGKLNKTMNVFEFGSGNSTIWYASRVNSIIAVEHNKNWINLIQPKLPANAKLVFKELEYDGQYCRTSGNDGIKYDIIIIDGRDRNNCVINSIHNLKDNGVIILDNSQRKTYQISFEFLVEKNFKFIDFYGLCPGVAQLSRTTVFYREANCLNI
ncbi:MAG: hypothetical protein U0W24_17585 [Bacteroidales bacterium]